MTKKILILGGYGMAGHTIASYFSQRSRSVEVYATVRTVKLKPHLPGVKLLTPFDITDFSRLEMIISNLKPDVVVNCIGVVKRSPSLADAETTIKVNSLLPQVCERISAKVGFRLIHLSSDCVYSGLVGNYREIDLPDPVDLYGKSKLLGEVEGPRSLTLRTSIIGPELQSNRGLLEWFLGQSSDVNGYTECYFSGIPTIELAKVIENIIFFQKDLSGVYHLGSARISKYDLLLLLKDVYKIRINIHKDNSLVIDRSLNSEKFIFDTGYGPPPWPELLEDMKRFQRNYG